MIYFDVSNLLDWNKNHFTGIERATAGILKGLIINKPDIEIVYFNKLNNCFSRITIDEMPSLVKNFIRNLPTQNKIGDVHQKQSSESNLNLDCLSYLKKWIKRSLPKQIIYKLKKIYELLAIKKNCNQVGFKNSDYFISIGCDWDNPQRNKLIKVIKEKGVIVCQMIHDLIPIVFKQWVNEKTSQVVNDWIQETILSSTILLANSEFTKDEIIKYCINKNLSHRPIIPIRLGDELDFDIKTVKVPKFIPKSSFFLFVSSIDPRKNHKLLYDALRIMHRDKNGDIPTILCIGKVQFLSDDFMYEVKNDPILKDHLKFLSNIDDLELNWYYSNCMATLYPSHFEGWGLPVAESLARGKACMASNIPTVKEISNDLVILFDPLDPKQLASLVLKAVVEPSWISEYENRIQNNYLPTTWKQSAANLLKGIEDILSSKQS